MSMFVCIHTHNDTPPTSIVHEAATAAAATAAAAAAVVLVDRLAGCVLVLAAVLGQLL
jgi:hypothetical protein